MAVRSYNMAIFEGAIGVTLLREGGYSNNPSDSGGETYEGISRNNWPSWEGWAIIDSKKYLPTFPKCLDLNLELKAAIVNFYRTNFWIYNEINEQVVANKLFDLSVNVGKVHSNKIIQAVVKVDQDGFLGPQTIMAINSTSSGSLLTLIYIAASAYHEEIVREHPQDAQFLAGWLKRDSS